MSNEDTKELEPELTLEEQAELDAFDRERLQGFKMTPAKRRRNRKYQQEFRDRQKEKLERRFEILTQAGVWTSNRSTLTPEQLQDFESRQARFASLGCSMKETVEGLKTGKYVGPPDGLLFPDLLYREAKTFRTQTDVQPSIDKPRLIEGLTVGIFSRHEVWHPSPDEFVGMQHPDEKRILAMFASVDPDWFTYGFYTRLQTYMWDEFLEAIVGYFHSRPGDENIDWTLANEAIAEWQEIHYYKHQHDRTPVAHANLTGKVIAANVAARLLS